jgi:hypothetical protein
VPDHPGSCIFRRFSTSLDNEQVQNTMFCDGSCDVSNIYQCKTQEQKNYAEVDFIVHSCNLQI